MANSNATNRPRKGNTTRRARKWKPAEYTGGPWPGYFCDFMAQVLGPWFGQPIPGRELSIPPEQARDIQAQAWWDGLPPETRYGIFRALEARTAQGAD